MSSPPTTGVNQPLHIVVMGVAASGKSTVAAALAAALGLPFIEGDSFHSAENITRMHAGIALHDSDRQQWLNALAEALERHPDGAVLACSALRQDYRQRLRQAVPQLRFLYLAITPAQARERLISRRGHYFPASLLTSQFETLEPPDGEVGVIRVDGAATVREIVAAAQRALGQHPPQPWSAG